MFQRVISAFSGKPVAMHARELVELASIASVHGPVLIQNRERIAPEHIEQYWTTSKVRLDRWAWRLRTFTQQASPDANQRRSQWEGIRPVLEEILASEVLTRVWTAVLCAHDRMAGFDDAEPVARSVWLGHMEARHRVLTLMVRGPGIDADAAVKLNRLRRRVERWTDLLVGHLMNFYEVSEFAAEPERAQDFAYDMRNHAQYQGKQLVWPLIRASLRSAFQQGMSVDSPNTDLNARIASSILVCFPSDLFDSTGLIRSLWLMRVANMAEDTQVMVDELLSDSSAGFQKKMMLSGGVSERRRRFGA